MNNDSICALSTAPGGALGIVRVSGSKAFDILTYIFRRSSKTFTGDDRLYDFNAIKANTIHFGEIFNERDEIVDEVMVSFFRAPHSYTGEDSVEISCHGSRFIINKVLELLVQHGCRMAHPGEYTQRAYLNGKMDLSQAEAVADLIASSNAATHKIALSQLRGHFSTELSRLREQLLTMKSLMELELDFSDHEDLEFADRDTLLELAKTINDKITTLAYSFETGNAIKQGVPVAIVGKTNVGKSTLLNRFLHEEKSIVSSIHGTTRDVIEDTIQIHGVTFRFIDTAGLRTTDNEIEQIGIEKAYKKMNEAMIILWVVDQVPNSQEIKDFKKKCDRKTLIIVKNKIDLVKTDNTVDTQQIDDIPYLQISAKYNRNINLLEETIYHAANIPQITENDVIITSTRHYQVLIQAKDSIQRVIEGLRNSLSGDLLAEDLNLCIEQLGTITGGVISSEETLQNIFQHFCVGK